MERAYHCCIQVVGPLTLLRREGTRLQSVKSWTRNRTTRSVLRRLLVAPGRCLSSGQLQEDCFPALDGEQAAKQLRTAISEIRAAIGADLVETTESGYALAGQDQLWSDLDAAIGLMAQAEEQNGVEREATLKEALILLTRGESLEGESGVWCYGVRGQAEDLLRQCRLWLAECYDQQGKILAAGEQYRALTASIPVDEEALRLWMTMLWRQGKQEQAVRVFRRIEEQAEREGLDLASETLDLARQIQAGNAVPMQSVAPVPDLGERLRVQAPLADQHAPPDEAALGAHLEITIFALALRWQAGPLLALQQAVYHHLRTISMESSTRRQALLAIAGLPISLYSLESLLTAPAASATPSAELLPLAAAGLAAAWELRRDEVGGTAAIAQILTRYLPALERLCGAAGLPAFQRREAAGLVAQCYLLASVVANHYSNLAQMEQAARLARRYGQMAQDPNLEVAALVRVAVKLDFEDKDELVLSTYEEALRVRGWSTVSPLLQGRVYAGLAGASAYCDKDRQALSYLSQAKDTWPADEVLESDPAATFAICGKQTLSLWEGLTLKHTGHAQAALNAFARFGTLAPRSGLLEQYRAEHLVYGASVALMQRDLEQATAQIQEAHAITTVIGHSRLADQARRTVATMRDAWPGEARVRELAARF